MEKTKKSSYTEVEYDNYAEGDSVYSKKLSKKNKSQSMFKEKYPKKTKDFEDDFKSDLDDNDLDDNDLDDSEYDDSEYDENFDNPFEDLSDEVMY